MLKRDLIRFSSSQIIMVWVIVILSAVIWAVFALNSYLDTQIKYQQWLRDTAKVAYEKTTYIEKNIEEFYNFVKKSRWFGSVSMYSLKKEFAFLIPSNVKIETLELKQEDGKIFGQATDYRTVDFVWNTLKTYSNLYWTITDVTVASSTKTSPTNVNFQIAFKIDKEKLKNRIYTEDIDGDWVKDFKEDSVNVGWVIQTKKIVNDHCPFTPEYFVIGKMLEQNPSLLDVYPKYKQMYDDGYFTLGENGCLSKWDYSILN